MAHGGGSNVIEGLISIVVAVLGIAIVAVLVGSRAQTAKVISAGGSAFTEVLGAALKPVS